MRRKKQAARITIAACLITILMCGTCLTAFAADTTDLDLTQKGSVSMTLYSDEAESVVTDGVLTIYEVADLTLDDGNMAYVKTNDFSGYDGILDVEEAGLANELAQYVVENGLVGTEQEISADGSVEFSDLTLGLYLVVQTTESTGYYPIDSFLVTVPLAQGNVWAYSVEATPKVEVYPEYKTPPDVDNPPGIVNPPETDTTDSKIEKSPGTGTNDTVTPTPTPTPTVSSEVKLPQTGQLVWPIAVFAACGGMFFIVGGVIRKKSRMA